MPKKRSGAKSKGRGAGSDYRKGYQTGWKRVEKGAKRKNINLNVQSPQYREGYTAGMKAARIFYRKRKKR